MSPSTVLVTGASRFIGGQLAVRLAADPEVDHALAVDTVPPGPELLRRLGRAEFVRVDLRTPLIDKAISTAKGYVRGFARRRDDVDITVLRFVNIIGSRVDTVLSRYFSPPVVPRCWAMTVGCSCCTSRTHSSCSSGPPERAYWGFSTSVATEYCWCPRRSAGSAGFRSPYRRRPWTPLVGCCTLAFSDHVPERIRFLNFGRVMDISRLRTEFGFVPRWTTSQAFDDFARGAALRRTVDPKWVATAERGVLSLAGRSWRR
jgi:UDP-glucose 4-epimerase